MTENAIRIGLGLAFVGVGCFSAGHFIGWRRGFASGVELGRMILRQYMGMSQ